MLSPQTINTVWAINTVWVKSKGNAGRNGLGLLELISKLSVQGANRISLCGKDGNHRIPHSEVSIAGSRSGRNSLRGELVAPREAWGSLASSRHSVLIGIKECHRTARGYMCGFKPAAARRARSLHQPHGRMPGSIVRYAPGEP